MDTINNSEKKGNEENLIMTLSNMYMLELDKNTFCELSAMADKK